MAEDVFIKIADIEGSSVVKGHEKELALMSWSWGASQSGTTHEATGSGKGKSSFQDISCSMTVDKSLVTLLQFCATGKHVKDAKLIQRKAGGDNPVDFITLELKDLIVSSVSISGHGEDASVSFMLNFAEFKITVADQTSKGGKGGAPDFGYNIAKADKV